MARRRFFVGAIRNGMADLRGDEARHLTRVLRAQAGQQYEISDRHSAYLAEIVEARGDWVQFRVIEPVDTLPPPVPITLCAALISFDRFEWMIEKVTELGVETILPVEAARTEKGLFEASRKRSERWMRIALASGQQSRRLGVPDILPAVRFDRALDQEADLRYFLEESTAAPLFRKLPAGRTGVSSSRVALLVGPEGGWTDAERQAASAKCWQPVSLSPQILRAETAAIAAIAILINAWMD